MTIMDHNAGRRPGSREMLGFPHDLFKIVRQAEGCAKSARYKNKPFARPDGLRAADHRNSPSNALLGIVPEQRLGP
jgi:hypothetical protein